MQNILKAFYKSGFYYIIKEYKRVYVLTYTVKDWRKISKKIIQGNYIENVITSINNINPSNMFVTIGGVYHHISYENPEIPEGFVEYFVDTFIENRLLEFVENHEKDRHCLIKTSMFNDLFLSSELKS
jgi:hypothetical protein